MVTFFVFLSKRITSVGQLWTQMPQPIQQSMLSIDVDESPLLLQVVHFINICNSVLLPELAN